MEEYPIIQIQIQVMDTNVQKDMFIKSGACLIIVLLVVLRTKM